MLDINNLNRVKGILSARQGAEIPKFQTPAGSLTSEYSEFLTQTGLKHNSEIAQNFKTLKLKNPNASVEALIALYNQPNQPNQGTQHESYLDYLGATGQVGSTTSLGIIGANPADGNPNAAAEASAAQNKAIEQASQEKVAAIKANVLEAPITGSKPVNGITPEEIQNTKIPDALTQQIQAKADEVNKAQAEKYIADKTKAERRSNMGVAVGDAIGVCVETGVGVAELTAVTFKTMLSK